MKIWYQNERGIIGEVLLLIIAIAAIVFVFGRVYSIRHASSNVTDYQSCTKAGYPVQLSYPSVCTTPDGHRYQSQN